jgi:S1-C subfamily serine protease
MTPSDPKPRRGMNFLSSLVGGLVVLAIGGGLIAAGVIDTGDTKREVVTQSPTSPVDDGGSKSSSSEGRSVSQIYKQEGRGVVYVKSEGVSADSESGSPFGGSQKGTATGSGFVVDKDGYIVTNAHVVDGASKVTVSFKEDTSDSVPAEVKGRDVSSDLAVLKVDPSKVDGGVRPVPLGDSSKATVGDPVIAIGNPFGFTRTVTTGIVSAVQRQIEAPNNFTIDDVIQTDAAINPGNSGGPLLDSQGNVIGVNAQIATGGGSTSGSASGSVGIGFAIPVNTVKDELSKLKSGGEIQRGFLGVSTTDVTSEVSKQLKLPTDKGALIQQVTKNGPAAKAGLKAGKRPTSSGLVAGGDAIVKVDGKDIQSSEDLVRVISAKKPGDEVELSYYRGTSGKLHTTKVTLAKRPSTAQSQQDQGGSGGGLPGIP